MIHYQTLLGLRMLCMHAYRFMENLDDYLVVMGQVWMGSYRTGGYQLVEGAKRKAEAVPLLEPGFQVPWRWEIILHSTS